MTLQSSKKLALGLGVASVAASAGGVAVQAGPALQTLNNITNTAEFTINNTYGQSFSVDGDITAAISPFTTAAADDEDNFNALSATLITGFVDTTDGVTKNLNAVSQVVAAATIASISSDVVLLNATSLGNIVLTGTSAVTTVGASISATLYGPSTVKATSSFTNQLINDLSAF